MFAPDPPMQVSATKEKEGPMREKGFKIERSLPCLMAIAASAMAGLTLLGWILGKSSDHSSLVLVTGGVGFFLILGSLGAIIYRGAAARVWAEDALGDSEERFRLFVEGATEYAIILLDREGCVVNWNAGAERIKGFKSEEIIGRSFSVFYPPEDVVAGKPAMELKLAAEQGRWEGDGWRVRADGTRFWANVMLTALKDDAGNLRGFSKLTRDITERNQALLKAGALQSAIFNSANFSSIATDAKGIIQIFNVGAERMLGYTAADVMNKITPADISDPQEITARAGALSLELKTPIAPGFEALVFKASRGIEDIYELTYVRKDGSRFPAVVSVTALRDAQDAIIGYLLIGTDNTARKLAAEALRKNEAQLHTIIENLDEGVLVSDLDGKLLHSNHAAQALRGYATLDESRGRMGGFADTFELSALDGTVLPRSEWPLARILRGEKLHGAEVRIRRIHADWQRVFSYGGTLVQDAGGQPLMAIATFSDITERRQAADLINQLNTDLERRVVERTAQLQTANNELEAFCYSVSHDLRAPLRTLDGFSQALLEDYSDKLDAQGQKYLSRIRAGSQRMGQLIDDLLSLSRVSRGEVSMELVDLSKMAHEVADELRATAPQRDAEFVVADGLIAKTDPRLLRIVLTNLFANAWKFTAKQPHAHIEFGSTGENRSKEYFMRDNGAGFDQAYSGKLFGAFQRLHAASDFPGTGIGLATVQRIIQRQGGRVWAEGKVEQGATFHFTL
jgi:PAS domain S-box-containing protein